MDERKLIKKSLSNNKTKNYVVSNLRESLKSIGFSRDFIEDLLLNLDNINIKEFQKKHEKELESVYRINWFRKLVPVYFEKYVIPRIPNSKKIMDIGCGTGILTKKLSEYNKFKKIVGIDITEYREWKLFKKPNIDFKIVKEDDFRQFLEETKPDHIVLTWTLHHMEFNEQERYLKMLYDKLQKNSKIIILEDSYSTTMEPEKGSSKYRNFMNFTENERKNIMLIYDWIANRILAVRDKVKILPTYRTLEEWEKFFRGIGFKIVFKEFIGFPNNRDIDTPQSLIVIEK